MGSILLKDPDLIESVYEAIYAPGQLLVVKGKFSTSAAERWRLLSSAQSLLNGAIRLQLVEIMSWVWSGKETAKGAVPEPMPSQGDSGHT